MKYIKTSPNAKLCSRDAYEQLIESESFPYTMVLDRLNESLRIPTKIVRLQPGETITISNAVVIACDCTIIGKNNLVIGDYNKLIGLRGMYPSSHVCCNSYVKGKGNYIEGDNVKVQGVSNTLVNSDYSEMTPGNIAKDCEFTHTYDIVFDLKNKQD